MRVYGGGGCEKATLAVMGGGGWTGKEGEAVKNVVGGLRPAEEEKEKEGAAEVSGNFLLFLPRSLFRTKEGLLR